MAAATNSHSSKFSLRNTQSVIRIGYCVFFLLLTACAPAPTTPFIPPALKSNPTAAATIISLWTVTPAQASPGVDRPTLSAALSAEATIAILPSPTPTCQNSLKYLADITIPDGTVALAGERIDKQWQVQNDGSCDWSGQYTLRLVEGFPPLGAEISQALYPARAGSQVTLQIIFSAPPAAGVYRSAWQAYDPQGNPFGETVYIEIIVQ